MTNKIIIPICMVSSFAAGFGVALLIKTVTKKPKIVDSCGILRIDKSEEDEPPKIFLELERLPDDLVDGGYIYLQVKQKNYV